MKRVFITGMSGTGKSSVIRALRERGYRAVDADHPGYSGPDGPGGAWSWKVDRIERLLDSDDAEILFLAGASDEQRALYSRFDVVILLSAPLEVILDRVQVRADNPYGSSAEDREKIVRDYDVFEPALRRRTPHVIDTRVPLDDVVAQVLAISIDPALSLFERLRRRIQDRVRGRVIASEEVGSGADTETERPAVRAFVNVVRDSRGGPYACPCCGFATLPSRGDYELCPVCFWEDEGQDDHDADLVRGGPNGHLSLTEARANFAAFGASDRAFLDRVRAPRPSERPK